MQVQSELAVDWFSSYILKTIVKGIAWSRRSKRFVGTDEASMNVIGRRRAFHRARGGDEEISFNQELLRYENGGDIRKEK